MGDRKIFAERLKQLLRGVTLKDVATDCGIDYKRLRRWVSEGIERPTKHTRGDLEKLKALCDLSSVNEFWEPWDWGTVTRKMLDQGPMLDSDREELLAYLQRLWTRCQLLTRQGEETKELTPPTDAELTEIVTAFWAAKYDPKDFCERLIIKKIIAAKMAGDDIRSLIREIAENFGIESRYGTIAPNSPEPGVKLAAIWGVRLAEPSEPEPEYDSPESIDLSKL